MEQPTYNQLWYNGWPTFRNQGIFESIGGYCSYLVVFRREIEDMMEDKMQQALLLNKSLQSCPNQTPTRLLRRQRSRSHSPESRPWTSKRDSVEGDPRIISQMSPETVSNTGSKSTQYET